MKKTKTTIGERIVWRWYQKTFPGYCKTIDEWRIHPEFRFCREEARDIDRALRRAYLAGEANGLLVHGRITKAKTVKFSKRAAKYGGEAMTYTPAHHRIIDALGAQQ